MLAAYFDAARFWRDIDHVMSLTIPELLLYLTQAGRIVKAEREAQG
jgi:hypothetical protein